MIYTVTCLAKVWYILKDGESFKQCKDRNAVYDDIVQISKDDPDAMFTIHPSANMSKKRFTRGIGTGDDHKVQRFMITDGMLTFETLNWSAEEYADRKANPDKYYLDMRKRKDEYVRRTWDEGDGRILFAEDSPFFCNPAPVIIGGDDNERS